MRVTSSSSAKRKRVKEARPSVSALRRSSTKTIAASRSLGERVLVVDIGGSSVKILATGQTQSRSFRSGPTLTPARMVEGVKELAADWTYDVVSIGYPGPLSSGRPIAEPHNLGRGWVGFDFARAFGCPVQIVNDAAMQALGSYKGGKMLFLGLGTGLGTALVVEGIVSQMEIGHLPYEKGTYEDYVGRAGLERHGKKKWRRHVVDVVERLIAALQPDDTVLSPSSKPHRRIAAWATMPTRSSADLRCGQRPIPPPRICSVTARAPTERTHILTRPQIQAIGRGQNGLEFR